MIETYSPLEVASYFEDRLKDFYPVPIGISCQLWDASFGVPDKTPEWHIAVSNLEHETPWEAPWGTFRSADFSRVFRKIALEIEEKFPGAKFPR